MQQKIERMKKVLLLSIAGAALIGINSSKAQIVLLNDYQNHTSDSIGIFQGNLYREGGFSTLYPIPNTNGKEFWTCSDRGVNVDAANANSDECHPTYDKMFCFPDYAPKIHRIRLDGDSVEVLQTIVIKRPTGENARGVLNPTGYGSKEVEQGSTDTVANCDDFNNKIAPKDYWALDPEGIVKDSLGFFWVGEENGPTIWKMDSTGKVVKRFTPYADMDSASDNDVLIDTVFKYRKNNRGFESMAMTPNGKLYTIIQSPLLYPDKNTGENTQIHRLLELDPATNATRMFVYLNDSIVGDGDDKVRMRDWKVGDMAAINDSTFLVIEAGQRGETDIKKIYLINIAQATPVVNDYDGETLESLTDIIGLQAANIKPVTKTLFLDLKENGWPTELDKSEGIAIINDSTIAVGNDNDFGQFSPDENGIATLTGKKCHVFTYGLKGENKIPNLYVATEPEEPNAIKDFVNVSSVNLYPNPASQEITIDCQVAKNATISIDLCDLYGRKISNTIVAENVSGHFSQKLNVQHMAQGLYFVRLSDGTFSKQFKVVVSH